MAVLGIAILALAGWLFGIPPLYRVLADYPPLNPTAAVTLIVASAALWFLVLPSSGARWGARVSSALVTAAGLLWLVGAVAGFPEPDALLPDRGGIPRLTSPIPGAGAAGLLLLGSGMLLRDLHQPTRISLPWILLPAAGWVGLLGVVVYLFRLTAPPGASFEAVMPLWLAVGTILLATGALAARPADGFLRLIVSDSVGGASARRLLLATLLLPILLGWLRLLGQRLGLYGTDFGAALFTVATMAMFALFIWADALIVRHAEGVREQAERGLRESEQRLFQILEVLPVGVFVVDSGGRSYYANRMSREILGKGLVAGARVEDLPDVYQSYVAGTDQMYPAERQPIARALRGERAHCLDLEVKPPGRRVPLEIWAAPVHDARGSVAYAVAAFSDVTEQRRAAHRIARLNGELTRAVAELSDLNRELEAFAYSVSHDLRAPIRHIDGFSRLLAEKLGAQADEQARHYLGRVLDGARHMGLLIDDLLHLSRVTRQGLVPGAVDLNALLRGVIFDLRDQTGSRDIDWRVSRLPRVQGDAGLLRLVFANLIANAVKFTGPRARAEIEIGYREDGEIPVLYVRDNGVGFDMQYADKLFGVFQRLHRQEEFEGTGVGLATVQRIVHKHGGRIWAEAELDKGAVFYFTLGSHAEGTG